MLSRPKATAAIAAAALAAIGALLVNRYLPRLLEGVEDSAPLVVHAEYDPSLYDSCGFSVRLPSTIDPTVEPPTTSPGELFDWALDNGGAPLYRSNVRLLLNGRRDSGVDVISIRAAVTERSAPLDGPVYTVLCEGEVAAVPIGINLDEATPVARTILSEEFEATDLGSAYFSTNTISLGLDETVPVATRVITDDFVAWTLEVEVLSGGRTETVTLHDHSFVSSGGGSAPPQEWFLTAFETLRWYTLDEMCSQFPGSLYRCDIGYEQEARRLQ